MMLGVRIAYGTLFYLHILWGLANIVAVMILAVNGSMRWWYWLLWAIAQVAIWQGSEQILAAWKSAAREAHTLNTTNRKGN